MEAHNLLKRFDHLIQMGERVIATKYMPPRGTVYFVDKSLSHKPPFKAEAGALNW